MALSINYTSPFGGEPFTYFIIGEVHENRYDGYATVVSYGFLSADARKAKANYVTISTPIHAKHWIKDASITQMYDLLKMTPEFSSATDI